MTSQDSNSGQTDTQAVVRLIGWLGLVFLGGWGAWCSLYHGYSKITEGEVIGIRQVVKRGRHGPFTLTYVKVRYRGDDGLNHELEETNYRLRQGDTARVRYPSFQPSNGRIDEGTWAIWQPCLTAWIIFGALYGMFAYVAFATHELHGGETPR